MRRTPRILTLGALTALAACSAPPQDDASRTTGPMPGVPCVGATFVESTWEEHPTMRRGTVYALPVPTAATWPERLRLIGRAHALQIDAEEPAPNVSVTLSRTSSPHDALASTTTDAQGRFCIKPPASVPAGAPILLTARVGELSLRHISFHAADADVSAHSEALVRLYASGSIDPDALSSAEALNLRTVSDTAVGLLGGVTDVGAGEDPEALVARMMKAMEQDERMAEKLAEASEASEQ